MSAVSTRRRELVGGAFVGLASVQFGFVVVFGRILAKTPLSVQATLAVRFAIAAVVLVAVLVALRRPVLAAPGERSWLAVLGVAGYAVEASLFFEALHHGEGGAVTLLFFTYPVFVALAAMALGGGAPTRLVTAALVLAVAGTGLVIAGAGGLAITGIGAVFAIGSALTYTGYILGAERVLRRTDALAGAAWVSGAAALGLAAFAFATGKATAPETFHEWWPIAGMGIATAGAFVCLFTGLLRLGAVRTSVIGATEPLAATLLAFAILGEPIRWGMAVGGVLILSGAILATLARPPSELAEPPGP